MILSGLPKLRTAHFLALALAAAAMSGCSRVPLMGGASGGAETGIRVQGDKTIIEDAAGPTLIIDGDGCQTVVPANGPPELIRDADGAPVCAPG